MVMQMIKNFLYYSDDNVRILEGIDLLAVQLRCNVMDSQFCHNASSFCVTCKYEDLCTELSELELWALQHKERINNGEI